MQLTDVQAWSWNPDWGVQPADQHIRAQLHNVEPRTRQWEAEMDAAREAAELEIWLRDQNNEAMAHPSGQYGW